MSRFWGGYTRLAVVLVTLLALTAAMITLPEATGLTAPAAAATAGDCNGNGVLDINESSWNNRDDDGDGYCNSVDVCPNESTPVNDGSACQMQAITVPAEPSDVSAPHLIYSGANITLKGIARYGGDHFMWDFGDGSAAMLWTAIVNPYNLGVQHVYTGSVGQTFTATLSVRANANPSVVAQASFPIEIAQGSDLSDPGQVDVRAAMAVENGLWYLHNSENRSQFADGSPGYHESYGYWNASTQNMRVTCVAADAFETHGSRPTGDYDTDPYVEDAQRGLAYALYSSTTIAVSNQGYADGKTVNPDVNGNGIGLTIGTVNETGEAATCLTALADSRAPDRVALTGPSHVVGRTYSDLAQDGVDYFSWAQNDSGIVEGDWGYSANDGAVLDPGLEYLPYQGIASAEAELGAAVPPVVRQELPLWLARIHATGSFVNSGSWGYNAPSDFYTGPGTTASELVAEDFLGTPSSATDFAAGVGYIYRHWNVNDGEFAVNLGNSVAMYAVATALRAASPALATVSDYNYGQYAGSPIGAMSTYSLDWYYTPPGQVPQGYATNLVPRQNANGSWNDTTGAWTGEVISTTALDVMILSKAAPGITPNHAAQWQAPTPASGAIVDATPGQAVSIDVAASDPDDGDAVTLAASGAPANATFTASSGNPATGTLNWTPADAGDTPITFTATDTRGLAATRSIVISAAQKSPTIDWATPAALTYGTALDATQLDASLSTAAGADIPPHPGTFTYTPQAGTVLSGGDDTLSVTWTPAAADATSWSAATATVTLHVNRATQTLSFSPPLDTSATHSYGDPPFTVTAVSDAGLPVTYSVGATDACTSTPQSEGSTRITITGAGQCTLSADQGGTSDYAPAVTLSHSFTMAKQRPNVEVAPSDATYGVPLGQAQLDATVTPADAATRGDVTYTIDGQPIPADGIVPAGAHTLTALYTPNPETGGNYEGASATATFVVAQASQTIDFAQPGNRTFGEDPFAVTASSDSGLAVAFQSVTTDVCAVTPAGTVVLLHAGTCTVAADQSGDGNYLAAARVVRSFIVAQANQRVDFGTPPDRTYLDGPLPLSATGGGSGNPVVFTAQPDTVCTVEAGSSLVVIGAGQCTITASQGGNDDYLAAADISRTITIHKATPTISWAPPNAISYGTLLGAAQLDATVDPTIDGTFRYTLADGATDAAGAELHASGTPQRLLVSFTPAAPYDADFTSASSATTILVTKAEQTIRWADIPTTDTYGDPPFPVSATGGGSGNPVVFTAESGSACSVNGNTVTITSAGPCVLDADQAGNDDYTAATTSTRSVTLAKKTPTITWTSPTDIPYGTAITSAQLDAVIAPDEAATSGTITYTTDAASGAASGQVLHAGVHILTATYSPLGTGAGPNYTSATATVQLTVDQGPQAITGFDAIGTKTYGDAALTLAATGGSSGNPVYFTATGSCAAFGTHGATLTLTDAGLCTVTAHQDGTTDYAPAPKITQTFQVQQASQTITFAALPDRYVGDPAVGLSATGGGSGNVVTFTAGPSATCTSTSAGTLTISGPGTCTVTASQLGNSDYLDAAPISRSFAVSYRICDLSDAGQTNKAGAVVQVRVTICDQAGHSNANSAIVLHAESVDGTAAHAPGGSQPGNNFRYSGAGGGSYQYNLDTTGFAAGTYQLFFTIVDDLTRHSVAITLR